MSVHRHATRVLLAAAVTIGLTAGTADAMGTTETAGHQPGSTFKIVTSAAGPVPGGSSLVDMTTIDTIVEYAQHHPMSRRGQGGPTMRRLGVVAAIAVSVLGGSSAASADSVQRADHPPSSVTPETGVQGLGQPSSRPPFGGINLGIT